MKLIRSREISRSVFEKSKKLAASRLSIVN